MRKEDIFGVNALWTEYAGESCPVIRKEFFAKKCTKAELTVCGLGFYEAYVNGHRTEGYLKPVFSDYFDRDFSKFNYPLPDEKSDHRVYANRYDVTEQMKDGGNTLVFLLGDGWLGQRKVVAEGDVSFSDKKYLCFSLKINTEEGETEIFSDGTLKYKPSFIRSSNMYLGEIHRYERYDKSIFEVGYSDKKWKNAVVREDFGSPIYLQECPYDDVTETVLPKVVKKGIGYTVYDIGKNSTGWLKIQGKGILRTVYAENFDGKNLDFESSGGKGRIQRDTFFFPPKDTFVRPYFRWNAFRYCLVWGKVTECVAEILHIPFAEVSSFETDSAPMNWLFKAYKQTQLNNMHAGIPSDCPHRERLGYTADGQLTAETALLCFDAEKFYRKWLEDIRDCQDKATGHVHHTAPLMGGGGGPGGWGGAIVFVPYKYYSVYKNTEYVSTFLPNMELWINHMIRECMGTGEQTDLIVRERKKGWCLGDWCTLEKISIPDAFVNTYLFIVALRQYRELCSACGREYKFDGQIERCQKALVRKYYDTEEQSFCHGVQGADIFAADIGLISTEQLRKVVEKYDRNGYFDTGIIGTDVLLSVLYKNGFRKEANRLLASEKLGSFGYMMNRGASTLWEYWDGRKSQDHPMFGSAVKYLFTGVAGIEYTAGFEKITVRPDICELNRVKCRIVRPEVTVEVLYERKNGKAEYNVLYFGRSDVSVVYNGKEEKLISGKTWKGIE